MATIVAALLVLAHCLQPLKQTHFFVAGTHLVCRHSAIRSGVFSRINKLSALNGHAPIDPLAAAAAARSGVK
jgi:hypothetical protein